MKISKSVALFTLAVLSATAHGKDSVLEAYEKTWKQMEICDVARHEIGSEMKYVVLSGLQDIGENDCSISLIFKTKENMAKFKNERISKSLDPNSMSYKGRTIKFEMSLGDVVPH